MREERALLYKLAKVPSVTREIFETLKKNFEFKKKILTQGFPQKFQPI